MYKTEINSRMRDKMNEEAHICSLKDEAGICIVNNEIDLKKKVCENMDKNRESLIQHKAVREAYSKKKDTLMDTILKAPNILKNGVEAIADRASERDTKEERSMAKTVKAFNAMYNKDLTEVEGWQFMVMLKMCRASQGKFRMDDYEDQASYSALAGEAAQG